MHLLNPKPQTSRALTQETMAVVRSPPFLWDMVIRIDGEGDKMLPTWLPHRFGGLAADFGRRSGPADIDLSAVELRCAQKRLIVGSSGLQGLGKL